MKKKTEIYIKTYNNPFMEGEQGDDPFSAANALKLKEQFGKKWIKLTRCDKHELFHCLECTDEEIKGASK